MESAKKKVAKLQNLLKMQFLQPKREERSLSSKKVKIQFINMKGKMEVNIVEFPLKQGKRMQFLKIATVETTIFPIIQGVLTSFVKIYQNHKRPKFVKVCSHSD